MARRRRDRWCPPEAISVPAEAREGPVRDICPPAPVYAWLQTRDQQMRVRALATAVTPVAVLVEVGTGQGMSAAWVWRSAVKWRVD